MKFLMILLLALFSVTATAAPTVANQLTWELPTERADGSALSIEEIGEYRLYCGSSKGVYDQTPQVISDGTATSVPIDTVGVSDGFRYCAMSTVDTAGIEGVLSNEVAYRVKNGVAYQVGPNPPGQLKVE